ncbi:3-oxoacid CoA-transferase, partial [Verminephrobacter sp. Larva24]
MTAQGKERAGKGIGKTRGHGRHCSDAQSSTVRPQATLVSRHRSSVGLRWPSKRIAAL